MDLPRTCRGAGSSRCPTACDATTIVSTLTRWQGSHVNIGRRSSSLADRPIPASSISVAFARSPTRSVPSSWSTWRISRAWSPAARIPVRSRTPTSAPRPRTRRCVAHARSAGLAPGGPHPSPFPHAHIVTSTAHKTLRGPRSGFILTNAEELAKKVNAAVFPALQGGPLMHVVAAKAVAFGEALRPAFKLYARNVVANAKALAETLKSRGLDIVSGGTDTHLILVDLRPKGLTGKVAELALGRAHITCNKNGVPFDPQKPTVTSGVRLGTPAGTSRGFGIAEFQEVGELIVEVLDVLSQKGVEEDSLIEAAVREKVRKLVGRFPIYNG